MLAQGMRPRHSDSTSLTHDFSMAFCSPAGSATSPRPLQQAWPWRGAERSVVPIGHEDDEEVRPTEGNVDRPSARLVLGDQGEMSAAGSGWRTSKTRARPGVDQSMATAAVLALFVETSSPQLNECMPTSC
jgi:hypothetical protein